MRQKRELCIMVILLLLFAGPVMDVAHAPVEARCEAEESRPTSSVQVCRI